MMFKTPNFTFSLTESLIFNPILQMRADLLNDPKSPHGIGGKMWHFIEAEIGARITALFTSLFAAADAFIHLSTGYYKGTCLLLEKCSPIQTSWNKAEVDDHFRRASFFSGIAVVGSVAGVIWPGVFKYVKQAPSDSFDDGDTISGTLPKKIHELVKAVQNGEETAPFGQLKTCWHSCDLTSKRWFVQAFNQKMFKKVREVLADTVYRPITRGRPIRWLNNEEASAGGTCSKANIVSKGVFFHATSEKALESILKARKVEVRHEKAYRGAFVSTRPELNFGPCVLAFKRNIERLSELHHGFNKANENTYWAGFSQDIPVNDRTLAYIILNSHSESERKRLQNQCRTWTGRTIQVILNDEVDLPGEVAIPKEWPEEGEQAAQKIFYAMQVAIPVPQQRITVPKQRMLLAAG